MPCPRLLRASQAQRGASKCSERPNKVLIDWGRRRLLSTRSSSPIECLFGLKILLANNWSAWRLSSRRNKPCSCVCYLSPLREVAHFCVGRRASNDEAKFIATAASAYTKFRWRQRQGSPRIGPPEVRFTPSTGCRLNEDDQSWRRIIYCRNRWAQQYRRRPTALLIYMAA